MKDPPFYTCFAEREQYGAYFNIFPFVYSIYQIINSYIKVYSYR